MANKDFFTGFSAYFKGWKNRSYRLGQDPNRDWVLILTVMAAVTVGTVLFNVYNFSAMAKDSAIREVEDISNQKLDILNEKLLKQVTDRFEGNKVETKKIIANPTVVVDPSQ